MADPLIFTQLLQQQLATDLDQAIQNAEAATARNAMLLYRFAPANLPSMTPVVAALLSPYMSILPFHSSSCLQHPSTGAAS